MTRARWPFLLALALALMLGAVSADAIGTVSSGAGAPATTGQVVTPYVTGVDTSFVSACNTAYAPGAVCAAVAVYIAAGTTCTILQAGTSTPSGTGPGACVETRVVSGRYSGWGPGNYVYSGQWIPGAVTIPGTCPSNADYTSNGYGSSQCGCANGYKPNTAGTACAAYTCPLQDTHNDVRQGPITSAGPPATANSLACEGWGFSTSPTYGCMHAYSTYAESQNAAGQWFTNSIEIVNGKTCVDGAGAANQPGMLPSSGAGAAASAPTSSGTPVAPSSTTATCGPGMVPSGSTCVAAQQTVSATGTTTTTTAGTTSSTSTTNCDQHTCTTTTVTTDTTGAVTGTTTTTTAATAFCSAQPGNAACVGVATVAAGASSVASSASGAASSPLTCDSSTTGTIGCDQMGTPDSTTPTWTTRDMSSWSPTTLSFGSSCPTPVVWHIGGVAYSTDITPVCTDAALFAAPFEALTALGCLLLIVRQVTKG